MALLGNKGFYVTNHVSKKISDVNIVVNSCNRSCFDPKECDEASNIAIVIRTGLLPNKEKFSSLPSFVLLCSRIN